MKLKKIGIAVGTACMGLSGLAQAELSANIGATSNYIWRGMTQTNNDAAISGGIDWDSGAGFYAGVWASNVDFGKEGAEVDLYGGYAGEAGDFGYDVGVIHYLYPQHSDIDFTEIYGSASYMFLEAGVSYQVQGDSAAFDDGSVYFYGKASHDFGEGWSIAGTVGRYAIDGAPDHTHFLGEVTKSAGDFGDFTLSVSVADGDAVDEDALVAVSWAKSFN